MDGFVAEDWSLSAGSDPRPRPARFGCDRTLFLGRKGWRPTVICLLAERVAALRQRLRAESRRGCDSGTLSSA